MCTSKYLNIYDSRAYYRIYNAKSGYPLLVEKRQSHSIVYPCVYNTDFIISPRFIRSNIVFTYDN